MARVIASWESSILRAVSTTIAPNTVGEIVWPCLSKSRWPTSRSIWKRLFVSAGCVMPRASDALRKLAWSASARTCRYCRNSTRCLPVYRGDNLWKNRYANPLAIPFALIYQVSVRGLVPSVAKVPILGLALRWPSERTVMLDRGRWFAQNDLSDARQALHRA